MWKHICLNSLISLRYILHIYGVLCKGMAHCWHPKVICGESNVLFFQTMSFCHLQEQTIITPEYLSFECDFFRGLLVHRLENCLCSSFTDTKLVTNVVIVEKVMGIIIVKEYL